MYYSVQLAINIVIFFKSFNTEVKKARQTKFEMDLPHSDLNHYQKLKIEIFSYKFLFFVTITVLILG